MKSFSDSYKAAGVDVTAGYRAVDLMKKHVARTKTDGAISSIGGFGGLFQPNLTGMEQPFCWISMIPSVSTAWPCASTT